MRITLDTDQQEAVTRMLNNPSRAVLNASQYGTGKTVVTVEAAQQLAPEGIKLITCPIFTKKSWAKTINDQYDNQNVRVIDSTKQGKANMLDLESGVAGWYIVGRELLVSRAYRDRFAKVSPSIDVFVYDECSKWGNRNSLGFKVMKTMKPKYKMALSATPHGNRFENMWAITYWLWPKEIEAQTGRSFWRWVFTWCQTKQDFFAGEQVVGEKNPGAYVSQLPCYIMLEKDFGEPIEDTIEIELSTKERKQYKDFEDYLVTQVDGGFIIAKFPIVVRTRLRQMTLGEVYVNEDGQVDFPDDFKSTKYDTLKSVIDYYPEEPMLILTDSAKFARVVANRLIKEGYAAQEWSGSVSERGRERIKDEFIHATGVDYIVATIASIGEGTDGLQARSRFMVWLSRSDNGQLNEQAFRRLYRRGQERQVVSVDIEAAGTYDQGQLSKLIETAFARQRELRKNGD
jgi:superfamily II DNA or RNA helicase